MSQIEMNQDKLNEYENELRQAMATIKDLLCQAQVVMGVVETFIHLSRKEFVKKSSTDLTVK